MLILALLTTLAMFLLWLYSQLQSSGRTSNSLPWPYFTLPASFAHQPTLGPAPGSQLHGRRYTPSRPTISILPATPTKGALIFYAYNTAIQLPAHVVASLSTTLNTSFIEKSLFRVFNSSRNLSAEPALSAVEGVEMTAKIMI